jgi:hypothetical protein
VGTTADVWKYNLSEIIREEEKKGNERRKEENFH